MKLLDTVVIVDYFRGHARAIELLEAWVRAGESLVASELTRFELLSGIRPTRGSLSSGANLVPSGWRAWSGGR